MRGAKESRFETAPERKGNVTAQSNKSDEGVRVRTQRWMRGGGYGRHVRTDARTSPRAPVLAAPLTCFHMCMRHDLTDLTLGRINPNTPPTSALASPSSDTLAGLLAREPAALAPLASALLGPRWPLGGEAGRLLAGGGRGRKGKGSKPAFSGSATLRVAASKVPLAGPLPSL
jgi:hypothetical protein